MKKSLSLILSLIMILSLAACGKSKNDSSTAAPDKQESVAAEAAEEQEVFVYFPEDPGLTGAQVATIITEDNSTINITYNADVFILEDNKFYDKEDGTAYRVSHISYNSTIEEYIQNAASTAEYNYLNYSATDGAEETINGVNLYHFTEEYDSEYTVNGEPALDHSLWTHIFVPLGSDNGGLEYSLFNNKGENLKLAELILAVDFQDVLLSSGLPLYDAAGNLICYIDPTSPYGCKLDLVSNENGLTTFTTVGENYAGETVICHVAIQVNAYASADAYLQSVAPGEDVTETSTYGAISYPLKHASTYDGYTFTNYFALEAGNGVVITGFCNDSSSTKGFATSALFDNGIIFP